MSTDTSTHNGRIDILHFQNLTQYNLFKEQEKNSGDKTNNSVKHMLCEHPVSNMFFSKDNMQILQNGIRYSIYTQTNDIIDNQSETELNLIMRSIYLQYSKNIPYNVVEQVKELNTKVLDYVVPRIYIEMKQYINYANDISKLPIPLERAKYVIKHYSQAPQAKKALVLSKRINTILHLTSAAVDDEKVLSDTFNKKS